jgi:uncharacterized protein DUF4154
MFVGSLQAQVSEYEYKAAFIERFTRFIEWPDSITNDTFNIVIIGKTPLQPTINDLFTNTKIKERDVKLTYSKDTNFIINANIVFISGSERKRIKEILAITNKYPILTISDSKGYSAKGVHINMYTDDNYIRYEINKESIENSNLIVKSLLLASAKIVKTND